MSAQLSGTPIQKVPGNDHAIFPPKRTTHPVAAIFAVPNLILHRIILLTIQQGAHYKPARSTQVLGLVVHQLLVQSSA